MASNAVDPSEPPRAKDMICWSLPDRTPLGRWCGKHPRKRTARILRAAWVCRDCVRESALGI
ncbi:hypothetical protein [Streptomyces sp. 6N223]|uniref:hypothetical protein n=1 Tax=Streptomyces sp. 6N223 TaxID=3457412 RepID=UPI003FD57748